MEGLNFIHKQEIIHRDFHSRNILCDNEYDVIISDLGISKFSTESLDNENMYYGIIPYIAPEIFQGQKYKKYTKASDIYSFGMIMWELMVEKIPTKIKISPDIGPIIKNKLNGSAISFAEVTGRSSISSGK
ncbi:15636_t:CDS:2 [Funneliformis geosporum]|uniref:15636_t:CDS:1 n=1 Tax=Funneliformis geosporum TaxID=1117311 RepID=A0A9W4SNZ6_9GLOM|nr:15636_t:CDS:2 [Funneliformis geosporum]